MAERRNLVDGLKATPTIDPKVENDFVFRNKQTPTPSAPAPAKPPTTGAIARTPISTRLRTDIIEALKRASLQRQLEKIEPNTLTDIMEAAIEPWLKENGYLA
jgi:hypothetical protein